MKRDLPPTYLLTREDGSVVELMNFRREPDLTFTRKPKVKRSIPGSFVRSCRPRLAERDGMLCHYCGCGMVMPEQPEVPGRKPPRNMATIEHIVPQSHKGPNHMDNLVLACIACNNDFGSTYIKCNCDFCYSARQTFGSI